MSYVAPNCLASVDAYDTITIPQRQKLFHTTATIHDRQKLVYPTLTYPLDQSECESFGRHGSGLAHQRVITEFRIGFNLPRSCRLQGTALHDETR